MAGDAGQKDPVALDDAMPLKVRCADARYEQVLLYVAEVPTRTAVQWQAM